MRIDIPEKKKFVYEMTIPVRWGDMDALGHVNNIVYMHWLEIIRTDWSHTVMPRPRELGKGFVVVNVFCNYYQQFDYPDEVLARMYVSSVGRSSFETWVTMASKSEPDVIRAAGGATMVWVDLSAQKSAPMPDWLSAALQ